jgi:glycosyltransferase involved in cell wall biosynthesis
MKPTAIVAHSWGTLPAPLRLAVRRMAGAVRRTAAEQVTERWQPYSRLFLLDDHHPWSISWDLRELATLARRLGVRVASNRWLPYTHHQACFYGSQWSLARCEWLQERHRVGLAYFHAMPGIGYPEFDALYRNLCQHHQRIQRIQVSYSAMHAAVLASGIAPQKVFRIPIGINLAFFQPQTPASRRRVRQRYGIPQDAVVIGSFQKDGSGWGEGLEPKHIKGPDVFLQTLALLKPRIPQLFVLLSGPSRGYVKAGLERLGIPYRHIYLPHYPQIGRLYQALDLYLVASRVEGGPKAVLESMASGVPLVTTRVGQAMDLVQHGTNGWLAAVEDAEALAHWAEQALQQRSSLPAVLRAARHTARAHSYAQQLPLWGDFLRGFVEVRGTAHNDTTHPKSTNDELA